jgi:hypothetical protein
VDDYNFGMFYFDWGNSKAEAKITTKIIDIDNIVRLQYEIPFSELIFNSTRGGRECSIRVGKRFKSFGDYLAYYKKYPLQTFVFFIYFVGVLFILFIFWIIFKALKFVLVIINRISRKAFNFTKFKILGKKKQN